MKRLLFLLAVLLSVNTISSAKFNPDKIDCKRNIHKFAKMTANEYATSLRLSPDQKNAFRKTIIETYKENQVNNENLKVIENETIKKVSILNSALAQKELDKKLKGIFTYSQYIQYQALHKGADMFINEFGIQFQI